MSNLPTLPDADVQEPIPDDTYDDDLIGIPSGPEEGGNADLPDPASDPTPSDVQPDHA